MKVVYKLGIDFITFLYFLISTNPNVKVSENEKYLGNLSHFQRHQHV